jgi:hypothetical protein
VGSLYVIDPSRLVPEKLVTGAGVRAIGFVSVKRMYIDSQDRLVHARDDVNIIGSSTRPLMSVGETAPLKQDRTTESHSVRDQARLASTFFASHSRGSAGPQLFPVQINGAPNHVQPGGAFRVQ